MLTRRICIPVAACVLAACVLAAGCAQQVEDGPVAHELASQIASAVDERQAQAAEEARKAAEEAERAERERLEAEAARAEQERIDAWRTRFPLDDYSNTLLIGDSLMQNADAALREAMPGVDISADAGRTLEKGGLVFEKEAKDKGILDHVRNDDGTHARYVIGAGNNDYAGMPLEAAEEIIARLGAGKEIYFITEMVVGNANGTAATNATVEDVVARYANVHKIDWHGLVAGHESEYLSDGTHARRDREPDYAACIKAGLDEVYG